MRRTIITVAILIVVVGGVLWAIRYFGLSCYGTGSCSVPEAVSENQGEPVDFALETVAEGLEVPWSLAFTGPARILVTERPGRIRVVENGTLRPAPLKTFSETYARSEAGLMGLALDPNYNSNKYVYVSLAYLKQGTPTVKIVRLTDNGTNMSNETVILDNIPAASNHAGNRIKFGPDRKLYITTGDATNGSLAQDMNSLAGKILRINPDGSIPFDNPFAGSLIYSLGHRNPQGIDWDPTTGYLWSTEHGPSIFDGPAGGDEVNRIIAGENYGWPHVSHAEHMEGFTDPSAVFTPAVAPSGMTFVSKSVFPQFNDTILFAALKGQGIYRLLLNSREAVEAYTEVELPTTVGRVRDITVGPDGFIYFTSSNRDGRGSPKSGDDKIYRLVPKN